MKRDHIWFGAAWMTFGLFLSLTLFAAWFIAAIAGFIAAQPRVRKLFEEITPQWFQAALVGLTLGSIPLWGYLGATRGSTIFAPVVLILLPAVFFGLGWWAEIKMQVVMARLLGKERL